MNRPRQIGTAGETAVVRYLREHGWPHAERRALAGSTDLGDVTGTPGICWEVKAGAAAHNASDGQVAAWLAETDRERENAHADVGVLVMARRGIGPLRAGQWWAVCWLTDLNSLAARVPIRLTLADACAALRRRGFGDLTISSAAASTPKPHDPAKGTHNG